MSRLSGAHFVAICTLNEAAEHAGAQHAGAPVAVLASRKLASPPLHAWFLAEGPQSTGLSCLLFACMHAPWPSHSTRALYKTRAYSSGEVFVSAGVGN